MTDTTKPKSGGDLETQAMQVDEDDAAIESGNHKRLPQETNAVDNSGFAVWCKDNGLTDQVVQTLLNAGFRTPKDLMDRGDDLKEVIEDLTVREAKKLLPAVERLRNASASNSVGNAALDLTTKDKQQPSAARDDSDFDDEDNAALTSLFALAKKSLEDSAEEIGDQEELIRRSLPLSMLLSKCFFGNSDQDLMNLVSTKGFHIDYQWRRVIAVVQSFGYGKTKTALRLTDKYIVLPIRFQSKPSVEDRVVKLISDAQKKLLGQLGPLDKVDETMVRRVSEQCKSTVVLLLLSLLRVLDHCSKLGLIDLAKPADRAIFAECASRLFSGNSDPIARIAAKWFALKLHLVTDDDGEKILQLRDQLLKEKRKAPVVFFIDEVHQLQDKCKGYCVHVTERDDIVRRWRGEQEGTISPGHRFCTDLFYQLRVVMGNLIVLTDVVNPAFVLCSTWYGVSQQLDDELYSGRGETVRFDNFRTLTIDECKAFIEYYFRVPATVFSEECDLSYFTRPLFISELIAELAVAPPRCVTGDADVIKKWFTDAYTACKLSVCRRAEERVNQLRLHSVKMRGSNTCGMLQIAYLSVRLDNGMISGHLGDGTPRAGDNYASIWDIVNHGVMRLKPTIRGDCLMMDERVFVEAIMNVYRTTKQQDEAVLGPLQDLLDLAYTEVNNDMGLKGFTFEHVVAWLALRSKLNLRAFWAEPQSEWWPTASSAAQYYQLSLPFDKENLYVQALLKGELNEKALDRVLLPSTLCGPDVLFHGRNGCHVNVAVQVKVENTNYTYSHLVEALASLAPAHMYGKRQGLAKASSPKKKASKAALAGWKATKEQKMTMREQWEVFVKEEWPKFPYHRVVFAALGFTNETQHAVVEYNLHERERTAKNGEAPSYIHLLNLDDVKQKGENQSALHDICNSVKTKLDARSRLRDEVCKNIALNVTQTMPLYREWRVLSESKPFKQFREAVKSQPRTTSPIGKKPLEDFCRMWGVTYSGKTIPELMDALDKHADDVQRYYQELRLKLFSN